MLPFLAGFPALSGFLGSLAGPGGFAGPLAGGAQAAASQPMWQRALSGGIQGLQGMSQQPNAQPQAPDDTAAELPQMPMMGAPHSRALLQQLLSQGNFLGRLGGGY